MIIRPLEASDQEQWTLLWNRYLDFYKTELSAEFTVGLYQRLLAGTPHFGFVAEQDGTLSGFVHCLPHASTWSDAGYLYLEDLFVSDDARGKGLGRKLIEAVYDEADARGLSRVYWHTDAGNKTARQLYDNLASVSDFVQYRRR